MQTVIGIFDNVYDAQKAVQQLKSKGFSSDNIDVKVRDGSTASTENINSEDTLTTSSGTSGYTDDSSNSSTNSSGSTRLSGNYDDENEGFGDKVGKFFKNLFGNDDEADRYSHVANKSGSVVTVHAQSDEESEQAADILDEYGAVDVNERAAQYGYSGYSHDVSSGVADTGESDDSKTLNVIKEDVQVGKRQIETGGVRLRSRVVERPVEEKLRLKEEKVTVERTPVDRAATTADFQNFKEGEIEMTERAEVAEVTKQARVVEEVKLSKEVNERTETVRETARDTEVEVENIDKDEMTSKKDTDM